MLLPKLYFTRRTEKLKREKSLHTLSLLIDIHAGSSVLTVLAATEDAQARVCFNVQVQYLMMLCLWLIALTEVVPDLSGNHRGEGRQLQRAAQPTLHQHQESYDVPVCQPEGQGLPGPEDLRLPAADHLQDLPWAGAHQ